MCGGGMGKAVRATALVNKHHIRKSSRVVEHIDRRNDEEPIDFTQRVLLSMVFDISQLAENVERLKVEVFTMAKAHGVEPPRE
jgi:hypothetical protein